MRRLSLFILPLLLALACSSPTTGHEELPVEPKSCYDLMPEGTIESMVEVIRNDGLVGFKCVEMVENHTDYADFITFTNADTTGDAMKVIVAWNTTNQRVYDISYYWHLSQTGKDAQEVFGVMETELTMRYGPPANQRVQNDDGYGTQYVTSIWVPSTSQGYNICLELSCNQENDPPLLMLEVTNPANE